MTNQIDFVKPARGLVKMACIATWSFGVEAVLAAAKEIEREGNCLDAVEKSVNGEVKK